MAKKKGRGAVAGSLIVIAILAVLGIGEFGLGGIGGGMVSDVFAPEEEMVVYEPDGSEEYFAEIMIVENTVTLNGEEVEAYNLPTLLDTVNGEKILVIDGGATHDKWTEVVETVAELDCVVQVR